MSLTALMESSILTLIHKVLVAEMVDRELERLQGDWKKDICHLER